MSSHKKTIIDKLLTRLRRARTKRIVRFYVFALLFGLLGAIAIISSYAAGNATLSMSVDDDLLKPNDTAIFTVWLNTSGDAINAVEFTLDYDETLLEYLSIDSGSGVFDVEASSSGGGGTVNLAVGATTSVTSSSAKVAEVTFKARNNSGVADLAFDTTGNNFVVRNSDNINVLATTTGVSTTIDAILPTVSTTTPASGSTVGGTVELAADASDNRSIQQVEFFVDGTRANGADENPKLSAPYVFNLDTNNLSNAPHTMYAVATDEAGNTTTSSTINFTVDNLVPSVSLDSPGSNDKVRGSIQLAATATDNESVDKVEFMRNGTVIGQDTSAPYQTSFDTTSLSDGQYDLTARATDIAGNTSTTGTTKVTIDNTGPQATITSPVSAATVGDTVTVATSVIDPSGVSEVVFLVNGVSVKTDTTAPYNYSWDTTTVADGQHTISLQSTDALGNVSTSGSLTVTVDNSFLTSDINRDNRTDIFDLSILLSKWQNTSNIGRSDINSDGVVNVFDLSLLLGNWQQTTS